MIIKNKQITSKQIIFTIIGIVLIWIGTPNIFSGISLLMTANYLSNELYVILTSVLLSVGFGAGLIVAGSLIIYKSKLLQLFFGKNTHD